MSYVRHLKKEKVTAQDSTTNQSKRILTPADAVGIEPAYLFNSLDFAIPAEKENRDIDWNFVAKICRGLHNGTEDKLGVFIVDVETGKLVDGNQRWFSCKKFEQEGGIFTKPFRVMYYKRKEGETLEQAIREFNADRKNWRAQDNISVAAKTGNRCAIELAQFCNERRLLHKESFSKMTGTKTIKPTMRYGGWFIKGINCSPMFKKGEYFHTEEELNRGKEAYDEVEKIFKAAKIEKTGTWFGEFVAAWIQVREDNRKFIASLPNGFDSLIPEFEIGAYVNETTLVNQLGPNKVALQSVINSYKERVKAA